MNDSIKQFKTLMASGIEKIVEACQTYVAEIDKRPESKKMFIDELPQIPPAAWSDFEAVGRGFMDHRLLWGGGRASYAIKKMPLSIQRTILDNGIEVPSGENKRVVPVENLTTKDIKVIFKQRSVRTVDEQRAILARISNETARPAYYIDGDCLVVTKYSRIPLKTLKKLVS